jgi:iron complex transport system substrate-binding protein
MKHHLISLLFFISLLPSVSLAFAQDDGFPRKVQDLDSSVTIEARPQRVVALNYIALQYLVPFLDEVELVGYAQREGMAPSIAEAVAAAPSFDSDNVAANLELILKWNPDVAFESDSGGWFEAVEKATLVVNLPLVKPGSWRDGTRMIGEVLGMEERAEQIIAETDALIQAQAKPNRGTLAIAYMYNPGIVTFETDGTALGGLLEELGFELASPQDPNTPWEEISLELAAERLNVDHILVSNYGQEAVDGIINEPVLSAVPAIAEGRYTVTSREFADAATFFSPATAAFVLKGLTPLPSGSQDTQ